MSDAHLRIFGTDSKFYTRTTMGRKLKGKQLTGKGLKGSLQNHLLMEKSKLKTQSTAKAEQEKKEAKAKAIKSGGKNKNANTQKPKSFIPFEKTDTVLLVGDGDFSFACSIVKQGMVAPENLVATSFDSLEELQDKYAGVDEKLAYLKGEGVKVLHSIDATNLPQTMKVNMKSTNTGKLFKPHKRLNNIMFNFPHTGRGMKDVDRNVRDHQKLVLGYFKSAKELFKSVNNEPRKMGVPLEEQDSRAQKILLSLFEGQPYVSWGIKILARSEELRVERSGRFDWEAFEGYHHKRTNGVRDTTKPASEREARIYVLDKALTKEEHEAQLKKKKVEVDSDED